MDVKTILCLKLANLVFVKLFLSLAYCPSFSKKIFSLKFKMAEKSVWQKNHDFLLEKSLKNVFIFGYGMLRQNTKWWLCSRWRRKFFLIFHSIFSKMIIGLF
jgi:hypothetical protein